MRMSVSVCVCVCVCMNECVHPGKEGGVAAQTNGMHSPPWTLAKATIAGNGGLWHSTSPVNKSPGGFCGNAL